MTALRHQARCSRGRADAALKALENAGFVSQPSRGGTRKLLSWGEIQAEAAGMSDRHRAVLARVKGRSAPILSAADPDYQAAYALTKKGALALADAAPGKPKFRLPEPDFLFLPNSLVDGFRDGDAPLARLRRIADRRAIATLMRVYQHANLPEDGGVRPSMIRETFKRFETSRWGQFTVWSFVSDGYTAAWDPFVTPFVEGYSGAAAERLLDEFWAVWKALLAAGLVEHVAYVMESSDPAAQAVHPFPVHGGTEEERRVFQAALGAALRMSSDAQLARASANQGTDCSLLCPVQSYMLDVQLVGIARPVHRANTSKTRAWARNFLHQCAGHVAVFSDLGQNLSMTGT
ncbi:hypothetical protein CTI14_04015 [Methylobacterium radiotolerans]|nr:hypothetical protein CTI14_04015 [Methylobacterium radiotolerans]